MRKAKITSRVIQPGVADKRREISAEVASVLERHRLRLDDGLTVLTNVAAAMLSAGISAGQITQEDANEVLDMMSRDLKDHVKRNVQFFADVGKDN